MQFEAEAQELPILVLKVSKQRLAVPDVHDVCNSEDVLQVLSGYLHCRRLLLRFLLGSLFRALLQRLLRLRCDPRVDQFLRLLKFLLLLLPSVEELCPRRPPRLEHVGGLQLLHALCKLLLKHPGMQVVLALCLVLPEVCHLVKTFRLLRECELWVGDSELVAGHVRYILLTEPHLLLIFSELHLDLLLWLCFQHLRVLFGSLLL
mmetsp:Transcript_11044/g.25329  ORF Transcript_11044/g.25329 Transcript_11044/m.25329 type:complete len:205 (+) Transcript_11044:593-1207(+)